MCLIAFQWQPDATAPLTIAANRDEFYARPTLPLHTWADSQIVAGLDLQGGGTWMGVHPPTGRLAALTNYRDPSRHNPSAPSRGGIVTAFLRGTQTAQAFAQALAAESDAYNPFNLLLFDGQSLVAYESRQRRHFTPTPGVHAVSNADFDTPWPKLQRLRHGFAQAVQTQHAADTTELSPQLEADLWPLLADTRVAADAELPHTGIPLELERGLSAEFINLPHYGTRASTLVQLARGKVTVLERSYGVGGVTVLEEQLRVASETGNADIAAL
jgi:uncharacterized protein with NRDE domain